MAETNARGGLPGWLLMAMPIGALVAVAIAWVAIDTVGEIGPLDKAKLGWLVIVPLALLVPVLTAWAGGRLGGFGRPVMAALVGIAAGIAIGLPFWVEYTGQCAAVGLPIPLGPIATMSTVVGLTLFGAVLAAGAAIDVDRAPPTSLGLAFVSAAVVFAIGFAIVALMLSTLFFGQCVVRPQITP